MRQIVTVGETEVELTDVRGPDDVVHCTCPACDPVGTIALCGYDVSEAKREPGWFDDAESEHPYCPLCVAVWKSEPCPRCGA